MTSYFMFPESFDPIDACFPSKLRPVPSPQPEPSLKNASKLDAAVVAKAQHDFDVLTRTLENHPDLRAALYAALDQDGAFEELFKRST